MFFDLHVICLSHSVLEKEKQRQNWDTMSENKDKIVEKMERWRKARQNEMKEEEKGKQQWKRGEGWDSTVAQAAFPEALSHLPLELSLAHNACA